MNKDLISRLWILLTVNYIFCDVFSLYQATFLNQLLTGTVEGIEFTETFLLGFSIIMEIPMLMIIVSTILKGKVNRITNASVSIVMIIIQIGSLITSTSSKHYIFFSVMEIGILLFIIGLALKVNSKCEQQRKKTHIKQAIYVFIFLLLIGCKEEHKNILDEGSTTQMKVQQKLKQTDLPIEVIQAYVSFVSCPVATDEFIQLRYELSILNNFKVPFTLKKVEIYSLENREQPIGTFNTQYIDENFDRPGYRKSADLKLIQGNEFGVLNIKLNLNQEEVIPNKIYHRLYLERQKSDGEYVMHPMEVAITTVLEKNKFSLGLPFNKKGMWLYEADSHQGARFLTEGRVSYPQRYAVDWTLINKNGFFAKENNKINEHWETYGVEIISVAGGKVVAIEDAIIENEPLSDEMAVRITRETIGGNYIIIDIGNDIYAFYGHFIPHSIRVKVGDIIKKGQIIGLLGNSGNSEAPHLHFHLETKSNHFFGGEGLPYHLDNFIQLKKYSEQEVMVSFNNNSIALDSLKPVKKTNEFPTGFGLIELK